VNNTAWFSWYGGIIKAAFYAPTFKPALSEVYFLSISLSEVPPYDTVDEKRRTYGNLCLLDACLGDDDEQHRFSGFWYDCGVGASTNKKITTNCRNAKWGGIVNYENDKPHTHIRAKNLWRGGSVVYDGYVSQLSIWNDRDYYVGPDVGN
jgi:hypothetical protein